MYLPQAVPDSIRADSTVGTPQELPAGADSVHLHEQLGEVSGLIYQGRLPEAAEILQDYALAVATQHLPKLLSALLILIIFYTFYRLLFRLVRRVLRKAKYVRRGLETLVLQAFRLLCLVSIGIVVLDQLGLDIRTIIAGVGIAGIALSFAARDTLENIISGASILADASFRIGDCVIIQGTYGTVQEITLRSTRIMTRKREILVVPNRVMANEMVLNHSAEKSLRVELPFSVGYAEHPEEVREIVLALTDGDERLRDDEPARVVIAALGDSGIHLSLWVYPKDAERERELIYDYNERVLAALRNAGIEIPYPHIHLKTDQNST